jgi:hypothetical protein
MYKQQQEHKGPVLIEKAGDNIFYNASFVNNNDIGDFHPIPMTFTEVRTTPLLPGNTLDYQLSVVKFDIPTASIPIQFFPVQDGTLNTSTYSVTISWNGNVEQVYLVWNPEDLNATIPVPPYSSAQAALHPFYYAMYNYEHFMRMINAALATAHAQIFAAGAPVLANVPPFLFFNSATNLISLYGPIAYDSTAATPVNIYFNNVLFFNFERSFPSELNSLNDPQGQDLQLLVHNNIINQETVSGNSYYVMTQEYPALVLMLDVVSIVLTSNSLPVRNEWIAQEGVSSNAYLSLISDYHINFTIGNELRNRLYYIPTAQYRYATMTSTLPIQTIDLQFYWRSWNGQLYPIYIYPNEEGAVKILFEKK